MDLTEMYHIESLRRQAEVEGRADCANDYANQLFQRTKQIPHFQCPESLAFNDVFQTYISKELIEAVSRSDARKLTIEFDDTVDSYRSYVENLLDVDLSRVEIVRTEGDYENAEGRAVPCGATDHIVLLPPKGKGFVSPDLLIHELGHTGEYTLRRASHDPEMIRSHRLFSEAIAHYCQYKYLIEYGTENQRLGAVGSVTKEYLLLNAIAAYFSLPNIQSALQIERILNHERLADFVSVYGQSRIAELLSIYPNQSLSELYHLSIEPRMGAILALRLIDNGTAIRSLCTLKADRSVKVSLESLNLDAEELMNFRKADALLNNFVYGTSRGMRINS